MNKLDVVLVLRVIASLYVRNHFCCILCCFVSCQNVGCDCLAMSELSTHFSPVPIRAPNSDGTEGSQSYSDFIVSLTKQVNTMEQLVGTLEKFSSQMSCSANPEDGSA